MLAVEAESVLSTVIDALLVGKEVSVNNHLGNDWAVLKDLLLDTSVILSKAVIDHLIENTVGSALVALEMFFNIASSLGSSEGVAVLRNETLALAPAEGTGDVTTFATVVTLVATYDLLGRELNWLFDLLANAIGNSRDGNSGIS